MKRSILIKQWKRIWAKDLFMVDRLAILHERRVAIGQLQIIESPVSDRWILRSETASHHRQTYCHL